MSQPMSPDQNQVPPAPPAPPSQAYVSGTPGTASYAAPPAYSDPAAPQPAPVYPAQPYPGQAMGQMSTPATGNFFGALFDMSFTKYITITWAKVIYILWLIGVGLTWLFGSYGFGSISGANTYRGEFDGAAFLFALIVGIVPALLQVIAGRMLLEFVVAIIRTEMNTRALAERR